MATKREIEALFEIQQMDDTASYLKRGRRYRHLSETSLSDLLAEEFDRIAAIYGNKSDWSKTNDLLAELQLRGRSDIPAGKAHDAFERLHAASVAYTNGWDWDKTVEAGERLERSVREALSRPKRRDN